MAAPLLVAREVLSELLDLGPSWWNRARGANDPKAASNEAALGSLACVSMNDE